MTTIPQVVGAQLSTEPHDVEPTPAVPPTRGTHHFSELVGRVGNTALALAVVLEHHAGDDGTCNRPIRFLADELNCSPRTVQRAIRDLEGVGWLSTHASWEPDPETGKRAQAANRYRLRLDAGGAR